MFVGGSRQQSTTSFSCIKCCGTLKCMKPGFLSALATQLLSTLWSSIHLWSPQQQYPLSVMAFGCRAKDAGKRFPRAWKCPSGITQALGQLTPTLHSCCGHTLSPAVLLPSQGINVFKALIRRGGRSGKGNQNVVEWVEHFGESLANLSSSLGSNMFWSLWVNHLVS